MGVNISSFGELASATGTSFLCFSPNFPNQECIPMPKKVGTYILVTDHRREPPGMMDKQDVYPDHGILFSCKKEWNIDTCYNVDELGKCYAK